MARGDRRRNARRERLRELLPRDGAVIGIDLAEDKQALAVVDHDVRVLAGKMVRVKAFRPGEALDRAAGQARGKGFAPVAVACGPAGPRWLQVQRLCAARGLPLVRVRPLVSRIAREQQDCTAHKTDEPDCVMIARLAAGLHCYVPEEPDEARAHLRHPGRRRAQLITAAAAPVQRIRDFLSVAWPAVTGTCAEPFEPRTWPAAVQLVTSQCGGQPARLAAMGRMRSPLLSGPWPGLGRPEAVEADQPEDFRRADLHRGRGRLLPPGPAPPGCDELGGLERTRARLRAAEAGMAAVLDDPGLSPSSALLCATCAANIASECSLTSCCRAESRHSPVYR
jgi:hypothetical protein